MLYFCFGFLEMYLLGSEFVLLVREMKMKTLFTNCIPLLLTFLLLHSRVSLSLFYNTLHWNYGHLVNMTTSVADQNEAGRAEKMFLRPPSLPSPLYLRFQMTTCPPLSDGLDPLKTQLLTYTYGGQPSGQKLIDGPQGCL